MGEPFGVVARFSVVDACFESEDTLDVVHNLVNTPLEGSPDVFMHEESPSLDCASVLLNPLHHSYTFPLCSLPSFFFDYVLMCPLVIL